VPPVLSTTINCVIQTGWGLTNTGPFQNLYSTYDWSGTAFAPVSGDAWFFNVADGGQGAASGNNEFLAMAVRDGDVAAGTQTVPESTTLALVGLSLAGIGAVRRRVLSR